VVVLAGGLARKNRGDQILRAHALDGGREAGKDRLSDQEMADVELREFGNRRNRRAPSSISGPRPIRPSTIDTALAVPFCRQLPLK